MSLPISISKTAEQLPVDPLLMVMRTAIGLGLGILMWLVRTALGQINRPESEWGSRARLRSIRGDSGYSSNTDIY